MLNHYCSCLNTPRVNFTLKYLTLSLLMTTQGVLVDSVDQDQTAQDMQSDL